MAEITRRTILAVTALATATGETVVEAKGMRRYRRIANEEGFLSLDILAQNAKMPLKGIPLITADGPSAGVSRVLTELGAGRLAAMDSDGICDRLSVRQAEGGRRVRRGNDARRQRQEGAV